MRAWEAVKLGYDPSALMAGDTTKAGVLSCRQTASVTLDRLSFGFLRATASGIWESGQHYGEAQGSESQHGGRT